MCSGGHNGIFRLQAAVMDASLSLHRRETKHKILERVGRGVAVAHLFLYIYNFRLDRGQLP